MSDIFSNARLVFSRLVLLLVCAACATTNARPGAQVVASIDAGVPAGQPATDAPLVWASPASPSPVAQVRWEKHIRKTLRSVYRLPALLLRGRHIIYSVGQGVDSLDAQTGRLSWHRGEGSGILLNSGSIIYASTEHGVEALSETDGHRIYESNACGNAPVNALGISGETLILDCGSTNCKDHIVAAAAPTGTVLYQKPYALGCGNMVSIETIDPYHVWITGGFSGAYSGTERELFDSRSGKVLQKSVDSDVAGATQGTAYLNDRQAIPGGRMGIYEPVRLLGVNVSGGLQSGPVVYAPDPAQWPGNEEEYAYAVGASRIVDGKLYVSAGRNLYRYSFPAAPARQHPERLVEGLAEEPSFSGQWGILRILRPGSGTEMHVRPHNGTRRHADISISRHGTSVVAAFNAAASHPVLQPLFEADANTWAPGYGTGKEVLSYSSQLSGGFDVAGNLELIADGKVLTVLPKSVTGCDRCAVVIVRAARTVFALSQGVVTASGQNLTLTALQF